MAIAGVRLPGRCNRVHLPLEPIAVEPAAMAEVCE